MLSHVFELLKKPVSLLTLSNIALMLVVRGLVTSFKVVLIVIAAMTGLTILLIPAIAAMFLFGRYKQLRSAYEKIFAFFLSIQEQLKRVDDMQITNLQIVQLKQRIKVIRQFMNTQQDKRK